METHLCMNQCRVIVSQWVSRNWTYSTSSYGGCRGDGKGAGAVTMETTSFPVGSYLRLKQMLGATYRHTWTAHRFLQRRRLLELSWRLWVGVLNTSRLSRSTYILFHPIQMFKVSVHRTIQCSVSTTKSTVSLNGLKYSVDVRRMCNNKSIAISDAIGFCSSKHSCIDMSRCISEWGKTGFDYFTDKFKWGWKLMCVSRIYTLKSEFFWFSLPSH